MIILYWPCSVGTFMKWLLLKVFDFDLTHVCRSRTLQAVHTAILDDLVYPAEIVGKRIRWFIGIEGRGMFAQQISHLLIFKSGSVWTGPACSRSTWTRPSRPTLSTRQRPSPLCTRSSPARRSTSSSLRLSYNFWPSIKELHEALPSQLCPSLLVQLVIVWGWWSSLWSYDWDTLYWDSL